MAIIQLDIFTWDTQLLNEHWLNIGCLGGWTHNGSQPIEIDQTKKKNQISRGIYSADTYWMPTMCPDLCWMWKPKDN